jgi:hypothetical protein
MNRIHWAAVAAAITLMLDIQSAGAHHSFSAVFDATKPVTLSGTVVKFDFINPHSWLTLDVAASDAPTQRWRVEVANPNALLRLGWRKDSVKPGDHVTVDGFKARDGSNTAIGREFTLADGKKVLGGVPQEQGAP